MMDAKLMKHGAFGWFELMTSNVAAAKAFYSSLFGWTTQEIPMVNTPYTVIKVAGEDVAGIMPMPPGEEKMPPVWGIYITVSDVNATVTKAKRLGGKILVAPRDIPEVGRFCVLKDPQGAWIAAIEYKQPV
jgi:predicted enzyme related to lactoylglutathione lyase